MPRPPFFRRFSPTTRPPASTPEQHIQEQINPTYLASSPTQEDWYWGRMASGDEEDFWWRRLSDNWFLKDVLPSTYLELHNLCYEAYNANPLAFAVIEITTSFVLGKGVTLAASQPEVQRVLLDFWNDPDNHMFGEVDRISYQTLHIPDFLRSERTSVLHTCRSELSRNVLALVDSSLGKE